jgi:hypothetical protein
MVTPVSVHRECGGVQGAELGAEAVNRHSYIGTFLKNLDLQPHSVTNSSNRTTERGDPTAVTAKWV